MTDPDPAQSLATVADVMAIRARFPALARRPSKYPPAKPGALGCEPLKAADNGAACAAPGAP